METKKDALTGVRLGAFSRAVACVLTFVLAAGMVPSGAIAYAAEGSGSAAGAAADSADAAQGEGSSMTGSGSAAGSAGDRVNEDVALDTSGSSSGEGASGEESEADSVSSADGAAISNGSATGGATKYTGAGSGQTSADVALDGTAKVGTIEYGGLAYTINEDDPATVSVTGLASSAPKGDLVIPSQVVCGSDLYKVTKIARGGGSLRKIALVNPGRP